MKSAFYCSLLVIIMTSSCRDSKKTPTSTKSEINNVEAVPADSDSSQLVSPLTTTPSDRQTTTGQLLSLIRTQKMEVEKMLLSASKTEANEIYEAYLKSNEILVGKIIVSESQLLEKFYEEDAQTQSKVKKLRALLNKYDLDYDEVGEGIVEIKTKNDFYNNIFSNYVTEDYKEYIVIKSEEDKVSYSADASLLLPFEKIGERVILWENLLTKYPTSKLRNKIREQYQSYQSDYLFGLDNTSTVEFQSSDKSYINPENIREFNRFMNKYPSSPTNRLIKIFVKNFKDEKIRSLIDSAQQKL